jgi:putative transposase
MKVEERKLMVDENFKDLSIRNQCELLNISRSSYYYNLVATTNNATDNNIELMNLIHEIWLKHPFYGYRKIKVVLSKLGYVVNHKKVQRLMKEMDLEALYQKPKLSIGNKQHQVYPYLLRDVEIARINQVWATDITYIKMKDGFIYLLAIIDLYSRFIVAANVSISLEAEFCIEALNSAILYYQKPEIFNTDQGSQFTSHGWIDSLAEHNIRISMDGKGRCFDNIFVERFWRTIKYEEVYLKSYETVNEARSALLKFIEFYNFERPHQSLQYKTPADIYMFTN